MRRSLIVALILGTLTTGLILGIDPWEDLLGIALILNMLSIRKVTSANASLTYDA